MKGLLAKTKRFSPNPFNASILFAGIVQRDRFRVKEAVWYDRSYIPLFFGAFSEVGNHTVVQARAQNTFSTVIASFMWLSALALLIFGLVNLAGRFLRPSQAHHKPNRNR